MNQLIFRIEDYMRKLKPGPKVPVHAVDLGGYKAAYETVGEL